MTTRKVQVRIHIGMTKLGRLIEHGIGERSVLEAARVCDLPPQRLYDILRGESKRPRRDTLEAISAGLDIPLDLLILAAYDDDHTSPAVPSEPVEAKA